MGYVLKKRSRYSSQVCRSRLYTWAGSAHYYRKQDLPFSSLINYSMVCITPSLAFYAIDKVQSLVSQNGRSWLTPSNFETNMAPIIHSVLILFHYCRHISGRPNCHTFRMPSTQTLLATSTTSRTMVRLFLSHIYADINFFFIQQRARAIVALYLRYVISKLDLFTSTNQ